MIKRVPDLECIPKGYGVAYREIDRAVSVCAIVPFNWLIRWLNEFWWRLAGPSLSRRERKEAELVSRERSRWNVSRTGQLVRIGDELLNERFKAYNNVDPEGHKVIDETLIKRDAATILYALKEIDPLIEMGLNSPMLKVLKEEQCQDTE